MKVRYEVEYRHHIGEDWNRGTSKHPRIELAKKHQSCATKCLTRIVKVTEAREVVE